MKFDVLNRWSGEVQFTAEIDATENTHHSIKLGLAVRWAVKARADLADANLAGAYLAGADLAGADLAGADLAGANLAGAYLAGADLAGAYLAGADLAGADLAGAYLAGAYLARANLAGADLAGANLAGAYLAGAYLAGANLAGAKWSDDITITKAPIQIYNLEDGWPVHILDAHMQIGCEIHDFAAWRGFTDKDILKMDGKGALAFWRKYGPALLALCETRAAEAAQAAE